MTYQVMFNITLGGFGALASWWMSVLWDSIKEIQAQNRAITEQLKANELLVVGKYSPKEDVDRAISRLLEKISRIESIEVLIAGHYVTKEEFAKVSAALFLKLDKIEDKLDNKADKSRN